MADAELIEWRELSLAVTEDDHVRQRPPAETWDRISQAIRDDYAETMLAAADPDELLGEVDVDMSRERTSIAPQARRRRRRQLILASSLVAVLAVFGLSALRSSSTVTHTATARNQGLTERYDGWATATAILSGNQHRLELAFGAPLPEERLEIWLLTPDLSDMVSLGVVGGGVHSYNVPGGIDLSDFSVFDVSIEPADGDPTHSGRSILRGTLVPT